MKKTFKAIAVMMLMTAMFCVGCNPDDPTPEPTPEPTPTPTPGDTIVPAGVPEVMTMSVTEMTFNSANVSGKVVSEGVDEVTERGICWSMEGDPDLDDNVIPCGSGLGEFSCTITDLEPETYYSYRAYAKNSAGVGYGETFGLVTPEGPVVFPNGILPGKFTINAQGSQVCFSQGNLQYQASTHTWRLAEHQWDFVGGIDSGTVEGSANENVSPTYDGWIDLFGWGTSGWDCGNTYYHPYDYQYGGGAYGPEGFHDLTGDYSNSDWGRYNAISNGGNQAGMWFTLSKDGWIYLLRERNTPSGMRFALVSVEVEEMSTRYLNGLLLFPDDWDPDACIYTINNINQEDSQWNSCTRLSSWAIEHTFAPAGAVFLPAAGVRNINSYLNPSSTLIYWTSSCDENSYGGAHGLYNHGGEFFSNGRDRSVGASVRLVRAVN